MFTNISWADYLTGAAVVLVLYYAFIGWRYFFTDVKELLSGKRKPYAMAAASDGAHGHADHEDTYPAERISLEQNTDDELEEVEYLVHRLTTIIKQAAQDETSAEEVKQHLQLVLLAYPGIKNSPLRSSVNELIVSECEKYGTVILREAEVDLLWMEAR